MPNHKSIAAHADLVKFKDLIAIKNSALSRILSPLWCQAISSRLLDCARYFLLLSISFAVAGLAQARDVAKIENVSRQSSKRYTFSWPVTSDPMFTPRGGTTQGPVLALDETPSKAWRTLQAPGISSFERDRRAILAMAGSYRVTFDFLEVVTFDNTKKPDRPYQSWGTERIYVDRDTGTFISLSHILEMRVVQSDGTLSEPIVMKHWRQDWRYTPTEIVEYRGQNQWERRSLKPEDAAGQWSQTVYQVDESPRYASVGKWVHADSFSSWISGETWRPLPRREWSVRKDYNVLIGTNRHTILPSGWIQEENNLKTVVNERRTVNPNKPYLAREYGVARYERLLMPNFDAADKYYDLTKKFWNEVQAAWVEKFHQQSQVTLRAPVDQAGLFTPLFEHAEKLAEDKKPEIDDAEIIRNTLKDMNAVS